jgi:phosphoglycolate phosphatase
MLQLVIFDVDGVLLDSLTPHLKICEDKNREYGLGLTIPNPEQFKKMVRQGVQISPMNYFFMAVGFPAELAEQAFKEYKERFMIDYAPAPFPGVNEMLLRLDTTGLRMGIVTSNVRNNVETALGKSMQFFEPDCIFTKDAPIDISKADALVAAAENLMIDISQGVYVGDQLADWAAANEAGAMFLGVTYGWGITKEEHRFPTVDNVGGIAEYILSEKKGII